jgi:hypothetical protein
MALARISLISGRSIELTRLTISSTYAGLLEGYPNRRMNDSLLKGLATRRNASFLIAPPRRYPKPEWPGTSWGPIEELPSLYCEAFFDSDRINPKLDSVLHRSELTVVWFQDDLASPVAEFVTAAVRNLAWDEHAEDYAL